jgi:hypothetical protein
LAGTGDLQKAYPRWKLQSVALPAELKSQLCNWGHSIRTESVLNTTQPKLAAFLPNYFCSLWGVYNINTHAFFQDLQLAGEADATLAHKEGEGGGWLRGGGKWR